MLCRNCERSTQNFANLEKYFLFGTLLSLNVSSHFICNCISFVLIIAALAIKIGNLVNPVYYIGARIT